MHAHNIAYLPHPAHPSGYLLLPFDIGYFQCSSESQIANKFNLLLKIKISA